MLEFDVLGAVTGIAGALMLALRGRLAPWAWLVWIVSSAAWIVHAVNTSSMPLLAQQAVFAAVNVLGVYKWLIQKKQ